MTRPRLLLVEDDASIRRFVAMALEDEAVDVVLTASLAQARRALQQGPFSLLMCDLMLPDGNGLDLLLELAQPAPRAARMARVVFSAGVTPAARAQLLQAGVFQVLGKPVSLVDLLDCTKRALASVATPAGPSAGWPAVAASATAHGTPVVVPEAVQGPPVMAAPPAPQAADVAAAVAHFFGGDFRLYVQFDGRCRQQFGHDLAQGERAMGSADLATLRRLAHSLKSVLLSLGHRAASELAAQLEAVAEREQLREAQALWQQLAGWLRAHAT